VFRITKNMHNILQGVSKPDQQVSDDEKAEIVDWIVDNARRYWLTKGGPLRPPEEGGADIIVVGCVAFSPISRRGLKTDIPI
jgi:alpha,alpha-trehalose phosphorylase (configuration-retaining)